MDICMCKAIDNEGRVCQVAHTCKRHIGTPNEYCQAWFQGVPEGFEPKTGCPLRMDWSYTNKQELTNYEDSQVLIS